jgi:RNA polymerase sigma factor (sigma-70 family)
MGATAKPRQVVRPGLPARLTGDRRLAELVARGDKSAFATIYTRYHQRLYRYCRGITRSEEDAQDALQATMMAALTSLRKGAPDAPLRPWLFRIAHNESINVLRARRSSQPLDTAHELAALPLDDAHEARDRLKVLLSDLADLPERQRGALVMRELSGLTHREIGAALEVGESGAKQAILDARVSLAEFEKGRAMDCADVRPLISDGDGRKLRGRPVRAHLRACEDCRTLRDAIHLRQADLRLIAPPMAPAAAAALLAGLLGGGGGGAGGAGGAGGLGLLSSKAAVGALATKAAAGTAIIAAVGVGTVETVRTFKSDPPKARAAQVAPPAAVAAPVVPASETVSAADTLETSVAPGSVALSPHPKRALQRRAARRAGKRAAVPPGAQHANPEHGKPGSPPGQGNPHRGGVLAPGRDNAHSQRDKVKTNGHTPSKGAKSQGHRRTHPVKPVHPVTGPKPKPAKTPKPQPVKPPKPQPVKAPRSHPVKTPTPAPTAAPVATAEPGPPEHASGKGPK